MGRSRHRNWTPSLELVERRELLSLVTNIMAGHRQALIGSLLSRSALAHTNVVASPPATSSGAAASSSGQGGFAPSPTSIALPQNQGPQGINLVLQPTGQITPKELKRELFQATFVGSYTIGPGRFSSEQSQVFIRGTGRATTMLHCDIQMRLVVAQDPTIQNSGASVIFDRNLNSNTALGFNLASAHGNVDSRGRPNSLR